MSQNSFFQVAPRLLKSSAILIFLFEFIKSQNASLLKFNEALYCFLFWLCKSWALLRHIHQFIFGLNRLRFICMSLEFLADALALCNWDLAGNKKRRCESFARHLRGDVRTLLMGDELREGSIHTEIWARENRRVLLTHYIEQFWHVWGVLSLKMQLCELPLAPSPLFKGWRSWR